MKLVLETSFMLALKRGDKSALKLLENRSEDVWSKRAYPIRSASRLDVSLEKVWRWRGIGEPPHFTKR